MIDTKKALAAISFPVTVILVPGLHSLANNLANLQIPLGEFITPLALLALGVFLITLLVLSVTPERTSRGLLLLFTLISAIAWLNTNFFVGDYGFLEGREPDWGQHQAAGFIQLGLILFLGVFITVQRKLVLENMLFIQAVLVITSVAFLYPVMGEFSHKKAATEGFVLSRQGIYGFSENENVILFVVDTLQADVVNEIFDNEPGLSDQFTGFTFFRNSVADFSKTYSSIPALLTGELFDNSRPLHDFLETAYLENSLPAHLKKSGYDVRHHAYSPQALKPHPLVSDNVVDATGNTATAVKSQETGMLANLALFRLAPHFLKPWVYDDGEFIFSSSGELDLKEPGRCSLRDQQRVFSRDRKSFDAVLFDEFMQCSQLVHSAPVYRFYHLAGVHAPLVFDRNFKYVGTQHVDRESYYEQTLGVLNVMARVLDRLREMGIYDRSTLLILGDHGAGELPVGLNRDQPGLPAPMGKAAGELVSQQVIMGGIPAILVKPAGRNEPLSKSDAPVALSDVPRTVLADLDMSFGRFPGEDMFSMDESESRIRLHRYYVFIGWNVDYILPMSEYRVDGFSWHPESWAFERFLTQAGSVKGIMVTLFPGGNSEDYSAEGWHIPNSLGSRIENREASLRPGYETDGPALLRIVHQPLGGNSPEENWQVLIDGKSIGGIRFLPGDGQREKHLLLSREYAGRLQAGRLSFLSDMQASGVVVREVRIDDPGQFRYAAGDLVDFTTTGKSERHRTFGWDRTEHWGTGTMGYASGIVLELEDVPTQDLVLDLEFKAYKYKHSLPGRFAVLVNGHLLGDVLIDQPEFNEKSLLIRREYLDGSGILDIRIEFEQPLAMAMRKLVVRPVKG